MQSPENTVKHTITLGDFEISTLLSGTKIVEDPQTIFGTNVSAEEFAKVSEQNFIPTDKTRFFFNPTVVRSGQEVILFDAGLTQAGIAAALEQAGLTTDDVTTVVITHMHGDHIGGLVGEDGKQTFNKARFIAGSKEFEAWSAMDNEQFDAIVKPMADKFELINDTDSIAPGITAMAAYGHTPGHMIYRLESGNNQFVIAADTANHYVWSLAHPDWEVKFDMDKQAAAATRRKVFGMLAAEKIPFIGYHMPFPSMGFVETMGDNFRYVPVSYQLSL